MVGTSRLPHTHLLSLYRLSVMDREGSLEEKNEYTWAGNVPPAASITCWLQAGGGMGEGWRSAITY